ncbi:MAG: hypothetical protein QNJ91_07585 [Gammaproteobacteria bacterium]|nr:hypothetical protein [Gammaproteobacteria bacterium]
MKFHQLPIGARFTYRAATYRKISPLKAEHEDEATQRLVPRSAAVTRLAGDAHAVASPRLPEQVPGSALEACAWAVRDAYRDALAGIDPPLGAAQTAQALAALESVIQAQLKALSTD